MFEFMTGYFIGNSENNQQKDDGVTITRIISGIVHIIVFFFLILFPFGSIGYEIGQMIIDMKIIKWLFAIFIAILASGLYFTVDDIYTKRKGSDFGRIFLIIGLGIIYYIILKVIAFLFYADIDKNVVLNSLSMVENMVSRIFDWMFSK